MGPLGIVDASPVGDRFAGMVDAEEQCLVQKFIPHPTVEGLAVPMSRMGLPGAM